MTARSQLTVLLVSWSLFGLCLAAETIAATEDVGVAEETVKVRSEKVGTANTPEGITEASNNKVETFIISHDAEETVAKNKGLSEKNIETGEEMLKASCKDMKAMEATSERSSNNVKTTEANEKDDKTSNKKAIETVNTKKNTKQQSTPKNVKDQRGRAQKGRKCEIETGSCTETLSGHLDCGDVYDAVMYAKRTMEYINHFKEDYSQWAFGVSWKAVNSSLSLDQDYGSRSVQVCDKTMQHCDPVVAPLPPLPHLPPTTQQQAQQLLLLAFGYSQRYSMALETLVLDQSLHKLMFMQQMSDTSVELRNVVQTLQLPIDSCFLNPDEGTMMKLATEMYVDVVDLWRINERGFRALRQTLLGMQYIVDVFGTDYRTQQIEQ